MPTPKAPAPVSPMTGLTCRVETGDATGYGYHAVRFRFVTGRAAPGDREITVRFSAATSRSQRSYNRPAITTERDGVLAAGATSSEIVLPTPYFTPWTRVWWDVWIDGVRDPALSLPPSSAIAQPRKDHQVTLSVLSLVDGSSKRLTTEKLTLQPTDGLVFNSSGPLEAWSDYTPYDAVLADAATLADLKTDQPQEFTVLQRWVSAGGALWVTDVSEDAYDELDALLQPQRFHGWIKPSLDPLEIAAEGWSWVWLRDDQNNPPPAKSVDELLKEKTTTKPNRRRGDRAWFAERRYGFGSVVGFLPADDARRDAGRFGNRRFAVPLGLADQKNNPKQEAAFNHLLKGAWTKRHGLAPDTTNDDFVNLLAPGVGAAPVIEFQVLITLFALIAGPINFWLLKRRQQTQLMVLTIPLLAGGVTTALLLFALLGDGLGTTVRVREVTLLDQPSGERTSWGRMSYYSALAPSSGFSLPRDCAMYPVLSRWDNSRLGAAASATAEIAWSDDRQQLRGGWLSSRSTKQYLQVLSGPTKRKLEIKAAKEQLVVTNKLGAPVEWLLIVDDESRLLATQRLAEGEQSPLVSIDRKEATREARLRVIQAEPFPPEGLTGEDNLLLVDQEQRVLQKRLSLELGANLSAARIGDNRLNQLLDELTGLTGGEPLRLRPRSYVAFAGSTVGVEPGIEGARQVGGFHVVIGRW